MLFLFGFFIKVLITAQALTSSPASKQRIFHLVFFAVFARTTSHTSVRSVETTDIVLTTSVSSPALVEDKNLTSVAVLTTTLPFTVPTVVSAFSTLVAELAQQLSALLAEETRTVVSLNPAVLTPTALITVVGCIWFARTTTVSHTVALHTTDDTVDCGVGFDPVLRKADTIHSGIGTEFRNLNLEPLEWNGSPDGNLLVGHLSQIIIVESLFIYRDRQILATERGDYIVGITVKTEKIISIG